MKKLVAMALTLCMLFGIIPFGTLSANAAVGDNTLYEIESNDSMATADRIYDDYTVNGKVYGYDMDYYEFTLSSKSKVTIITVADYSCFMGGVFNSSNKAVAANSFEDYEDGFYTYSLSADLNAGTYYYVVFNEDGLELNDNYTFYLSIHTHSYDNACDSICNTCESKRTPPHSYGKGVVTKAATCTKEGVRTYKCSGCGKNKTESIAKVNHKYYDSSTTKATTTKNGKLVKKCKVCNKTTSTTINYAKTFKLSSSSYTYNGKVKTPEVTVKDSAGKALKKNTDYTVTYASGRKNIGKYTVTVKMKGKYSGKKTLSFNITPTKTTISKLTAGKKSIKVKINKKTKQVSGYQIQYATSKSFNGAKTKTVTSNKTTTVTLESLKAKKLYYVRVRTYKTIKGKKYYSAWSAAKTKATTHTHNYSKATCTKAKTCKICAATSGKALGHTNTVKCTRCKKNLFTKLTYKGTGIKKISNIKLPKGDFILKLVAEATNDDVIDNCFVYFYNDNSLLEAYTSAGIYSFSRKEEDTDVFEGPISKGTLKIDTSDEIRWTITITPY